MAIVSKMAAMKSEMKNGEAVDIVSGKHFQRYLCRTITARCPPLTSVPPSLSKVLISLWQSVVILSTPDGGPPPRVQLLDPDPGGGDNWKPDKMPYLASLRLQAGLSKAQSSILTQVRTGKIGLAAFLCKRRVPGFPTPACSCGAQWETARHVVVACPRLLRARRSLHAAAATTDYQVMTSRPRPAAALTAWILRHGVLPQFSWAQEQLEAGY